jgi:starch synthase
MADCGDRPAPDLLARVAFAVAAQRKSWPNIVHVSDDTAVAATMTPTLTPGSGLTGNASPHAAVMSIGAPSTLGPDAERALAVADRIALTSSTYAREMVAETPATSELARALAPVRDRVRGIAHGIDDARWSPARDGFTPAQFSADDPSGKAECKLELQREVGLPPRPRTPLISARGPFRLLSADAADAIAAADVQVVFLIDPARDGSSAPMLRELARRQPTRIASCALADPHEREAMTHRLIAGADFDLLTETFVPGGHSDLYFMAYGTVPIAPRCGGWGDAMVDFDRISGTGNSFLFSRDGDGLVSAVFRAARVYRTPQHQGLVLRAFAQDLSWRSAARRYADLYREALDSHAQRT